jgi:hypothetical protein
MKHFSSFTLLILAVLFGNNLNLNAQHTRSLKLNHGLNKKLGPKITRMNVIKSSDPDKATITLKVIGDPYGDGSGFQMLLDSKCRMTEEANTIPACFEMADYFLPVGATMDFENMIMVSPNETVSITVPEGEYDYIFLNPIPNDKMYIIAAAPDGNEAMGSSFPYLAGFEYIYVIEEKDGITEPPIELLPMFDAELVNLIVPCGENLSDEEPVQVVFTNLGQVPFSNIELSYRINYENAVREIYEEEVFPGDTVTYTFKTTADFSKKDIYRIIARIYYDEDMNPENNSLLKLAKHLPLPLPFISRFDSPVDTRYFTIIDNNNDESTWYYDYYKDAGGSDDQGSIGIQFPNADNADDYLITEALHLPEAGDYHISFDALAWRIGTESFQILCGTSPNPELMDVLSDYSSYQLNGEWMHIVKNFLAPAAGNYYFAIRYYSSREDARYLNIDNISIEQGIVEEKANLYLRKLILPPSSCNLLSAPVTLVVSNIGTAPTSKMILTYLIDDKNPGVTRIENHYLDVMETMTYTFDTPADLSATGTYSISAIAVATEGESTYENNQRESFVANFEPVENFPFNSDFSRQNDTKEWNPTTFDGWTVTDGTYQAHTDNAALFSRCIHLPAGKYSFSYTFSAGITIADQEIGASFYIACGKAGTDPLSWESLFESEIIYTDEPLTSEIVLNITEEDDYSIAFVPTYLLFDNLYLHHTSLVKIKTGTVKIHADELSLSPNPVKDILTVKASQIIERITINDVTGKTVYRDSAVNASSCQLNVSRLIPGVYFVTVQTGAGVTTSQIVVK